MIRILLKLVAFSAVCLLFTVWLAFTIGNIQPFRHTYSLSATFDDVTGLLVNDNVKVSGVVVGKVTGVHVEQGKARVDFTVDRDVKLPTDTETAVRWRNLLGQRYLYLYPGHASTDLTSGAHIPLRQSRSIVDLGELFNRLGPIVQAVDPKAVNQFLEAVTGALEQGNDAALGQSIHNLGVIAKALGGRDAEIGRLVQNLSTLTGAVASRDQELRTILDNVTELAATFNEHNDVLQSTVDDLGRFSETMGTLLKENRPGIDRIILRVNEILDVVHQRLGTVDRTVAGLDEFGLSLFDAARYGEWLNQFIPCENVDVDGPNGALPPVSLDSACSSQTSASAAGVSTQSTPPHEVASILERALGGEG